MNLASITIVICFILTPISVGAVAFKEVAIIWAILFTICAVGLGALYCMAIAYTEKKCFDSNNQENFRYAAYAVLVPIIGIGGPFLAMFLNEFIIYAAGLNANI